ncbi:hypothetical protein M8J77_006709 [Diaphorina citri]|nr:hypothetical protein M8J77_006709 [Diaphorina citri]
MMEQSLSTSTKLLLLGVAGVGATVYAKYLYEAVKRTKQKLDKLLDSGSDGSIRFIENETCSSSHYFDLESLSLSGLTWMSTIKADHAPIYMVLLNSDCVLTRQEYKNYVKRVSHVSLKKMQAQDASFFAEWNVKRVAYTVKVNGEEDLVLLHQKAKARGIPRLLMMDESNTTCVVLGLGPARAIDVKIVLYDNLSPPTPSESKLS